MLVRLMQYLFTYCVYFLVQNPDTTAIVNLGFTYLILLCCKSTLHNTKC